MIDEENLLRVIKYFKKIVKSENTDYLTGYMSALSTVEGLIAEQPKIGEWVLCSEDNLPDEEVLCLNKYGKMAIGRIFKSFVYDGTFEVECEYENMYYCVAWMPKPKEYRKDGANG